jgi:7,8-dihydro-6-hydroxymethylpterin-pyrophosphokinase
MAILNIRWHGIIAGAAGKSAEDLLDLFAATDALRRPNRFMQLVKCSDCLHTQNAASVSQATFLATAVKAITHLDYQNIVDAGVDIPQRIRQKRLDILKDFLQKEQT